MTWLDRDFQEEPRESSYLFPSTVSLCINGMNSQKSICLPSFPSKEPRSLTHVSLEPLSPTLFPTKLPSHHPLGLKSLTTVPYICSVSQRTSHRPMSFSSPNTSFCRNSLWPILRGYDKANPFQQRAFRRGLKFTCARLHLNHWHLPAS